MLIRKHTQGGEGLNEAAIKHGVAIDIRFCSDFAAIRPA
jgi:hypothetical protein